MEDVTEEILRGYVRQGLDADMVEQLRDKAALQADGYMEVREFVFRLCREACPPGDEALWARAAILYATGQEADGLVTMWLSSAQGLDDLLGEAGKSAIVAKVRDRAKAMKAAERR